MKNEPKAQARFRIEEDALGDVEVPAEHLWVRATSARISIFPSESSVSAGAAR